ncbi:CIC11C00000002139 [Sungouiella intermedia]|uniref:CIC11C00000002139 n=1 Tax=Sungouiella intermedia TaxID=45354 RepID=A0A1L0C1M9_9ASCO|nr:CIC11C00000002139 [[Candida] intermedia]
MISAFRSSRAISRNLHVLRLPIIYFARPSRAYSQPAPTAPKAFKSASFALPKETPESKVDTSNVIQDDNLRDFHLTKITSGHTDLKIGITDRAKAKLVQIAEDDHNPNSALRIRVESGGCHGFQYNLDLTDVKEELSKDEDLVVFERSDDNRARVIFDESSLEILQDSKVDYTKELIGSSFKVVDSPYTSTSCGCGASFDFDFEKLERAKGGH